MSDDDSTVRAPERSAWRVPQQRRPAPAQAVTAEDLATSGAAQEILDALVAQPWGDVSPSEYETGRLVTLAPWLAGHAVRVDFLLRSQRPDGGWGGPEGYALVPTLSATEALLTTLRRDEPSAARESGELSRAVHRGLRALSGLLPTLGDHNLPDTPAVEIIVPSLVAALNQHLDRLPAAPITGLDAWWGGRLPQPSGMDNTLTMAIRARLEAGAAVPAKLLHSMEVAGSAAVGALGIQPLPLGMIGASPAATAAWLGDPCSVDSQHRAVRYLEAVVDLHGGPVPSVIPITAFERSWVLSGLATAGPDLNVPDELVASLLATLDVDGTAGGPGLPPDADTTSATLHALARLGAPRSMECLHRYETDTHFCTWDGERTPSATTNAHVLDALADVIGLPGASGWPAAAAHKVSTWLCDQQLNDGTWLDKWHASPYYATVCCAVALSRVRLVDGSTEARRMAACVRRSVSWVLDTQRQDGSWGRWDGTAEETAYAIQILLLTGPPTVAAEHAVARGYPHLHPGLRLPPLWHDKDLYVPRNIVRAACLGALRPAHAAAGVMALLQRD